MIIPHTDLAPETLRAVIQEFVTRDGTDNSPITPRVETVLRQFDSGELVLNFDPDTNSCNIASRA